MLYTFLVLIGSIMIGRFIVLPFFKDKAYKFAEVLSRVGLNLFFPAVIIHQAPLLWQTENLLIVGLIPWLVVAVVILFSFFFADKFFSKSIWLCIALGLSFGNTAFLGYSVITNFIGDHALRYAVVSDQLGSFLALSSVGLILIHLYLGQKKPSFKLISLNVLKFPPFVALLIGVFFIPLFKFDQLFFDILKILGLFLLPTMAVALGVRLKFKISINMLKPLCLVVGGKLIVVPLLTLVLCFLFDQQGVIRDVIVLQSAMPVMVTVGALLVFYKIEVEFVSAIIAYSTFFSVISLPCWHFFLTKIM